MTLNVELPDDETVALNAKAKAYGMSAEQYVRRMIENDLAPEWLRASWESAHVHGLDNLSLAEIDLEISAARKARHPRRAESAE